MTNPKAKLKRPNFFPLRLNKKEKDELSRRAEETGLSMVEYIRRKIFDVPMSSIKQRR